MVGCHAVYRRVESRENSTNDPAYDKANVWDNEMESALAEFAVCKHYGIFWSGASMARAVDAGTKEIRWTSRADDGGLIVRHRDRPKAIYVLVVGRAPQFYAVGWLFGYEAMQSVYKKFGEFLVPRAQLRQISTLEPMANLDAEVRAKECIR